MILMTHVSQIFLTVQMCVTAMILFKPIGMIVMVMVWVEKPAMISVPLMFHLDGCSIIMMMMMTVTPIIMTVREYVMDLHR